jgi:1,2-dihydroxy-3-keto-5-methylthiopentene dioxygenase
MDQSSPTPLLVSETPVEIQAELARRGICFEQWPAVEELPSEADQAWILKAYANDIARVKSYGDYATVDAIRMTPDHPERGALRSKFLAEHIHAEDEVRFFVEGRGLFCLHIGAEVLLTLCERGDLIRVPAGTKHWFDMGSEPAFCAVRWFNNTVGWVATFTGNKISERFPKLD